MSTFKLAIFDMAGTTVEEGGAVYRTLKESVEKHDFPVSPEKLSQIAGMNKYEAIHYLLPEPVAGDQALIDTIFEDFKNRLDQIYLHDPFVSEKPGVTQLFEKLRKKGIRVALNTGYARAQATILIDRLQWHEHIDDSITSDEVDRGRPHTDMIFALMKRANIHDCQKVVKVGDTINDIQEGLNANCGLVVGVLGGAHNEEQLSEANLILDEIATLSTHL